MSSPSSPEREPAELLQHAFASLYAAQTPADVLDALARLLPPGFASAELLLADRAAPDTLALAATWTPAGAQLAREARALRDYPPSSAGVLAIADVAADPSLSETARAWLIRKGIGALVLMPMSTGQAPAGLVMFTAPVPVDVSAERVQVLRVLSDLAAMALQNQRVLQSTAERDSGQVDLPRLLNQTSNRLAQFTEQAALLDYVTEELSRLADIDHVGIVLLEPDGVYGRVISEYPPSAALGSLLNMQENPLLKMALRDPDRPLIVEDAQRSDLLPDETKALFARMGVQEMMIVPLVVAGELIGSMGLDIYSHDKHFSEDTVEIGRLIGTQMAISLQNIRLVTGERQRAERLTRQVTLLQVLSQTSNRLAQFTEQAALLDYVTEELSRLADIDHVGIVLLEPDGVYGRVISEYPPSAALGSLLNMQENPLLTMALRDPDHPLIVEDAQHSALLPAETKALFTTMGVQDLMIVPLVVAGELIGSMGLDIYSPDKHFSEDAVEIGRLIGTQMVTSLQNIRLLSSERQRAEELAQIARNEMLLSQIGARYQQVQSVDDLLQVTLEELGAALGAERASIRMSAGDAPLLEAGR
jgi:GAF domain-containing protein